MESQDQAGREGRAEEVAEVELQSVVQSAARWDLPIGEGRYQHRHTY